MAESADNHVHGGIVKTFLFWFLPLWVCLFVVDVMARFDFWAAVNHGPTETPADSASFAMWIISGASLVGYIIYRITEIDGYSGIVNHHAYIWFTTTGLLFSFMSAECSTGQELSADGTTLVWRTYQNLNEAAPPAGQTMSTVQPVFVTWATNITNNSYMQGSVAMFILAGIAWFVYTMIVLVAWMHSINGDQSMDYALYVRMDMNEMSLELNVLVIYFFLAVSMILASTYQLFWNSPDAVTSLYFQHEHQVAQAVAALFAFAFMSMLMGWWAWFDQHEYADELFYVIGGREYKPMTRGQHPVLGRFFTFFSCSICGVDLDVRDGVSDIANKFSQHLPGRRDSSASSATMKSG